MTFDETLTAVRAWLGEEVVVELEPEGTVMRGRLSELDAAGVDGALFALDQERTGGVALALFRDGVTAAVREDDRLVVRQGVVTVTVYLWR